MSPKRQFQLLDNGSLFDVFLVTVKENSKGNEMSGEFTFSRLKMGKVKKFNIPNSRLYNTVISI